MPNTILLADQHQRFGQKPKLGGQGASQCCRHYAAIATERNDRPATGAVNYRLRTRSTERRYLHARRISTPHCDAAANQVENEKSRTTASVPRGCTSMREDV